jgi:hypothetical protein
VRRSKNKRSINKSDRTRVSEEKDEVGEKTGGTPTRLRPEEKSGAWGKQELEGEGEKIEWDKEELEGGQGEER